MAMFDIICMLEWFGHRPRLMFLSALSISELKSHGSFGWLDYAKNESPQDQYLATKLIEY